MHIHRLSLGDRMLQLHSDYLHLFERSFEKHVPEEEEERRLLLLLDPVSSTLCILLAAAVAPVGWEAGTCAHSNQDHLQPVNVCPSVKHSRLVMDLFVKLLCFMLRGKERATGRQTAFMNSAKWHFSLSVNE